jgi:hypothetical protein
VAQLGGAEVRLLLIHSEVLGRAERMGRECWKPRCGVVAAAGSSSRE